MLDFAILCTCTVPAQKFLTHLLSVLHYFAFLLRSALKLWCWRCFFISECLFVYYSYSLSLFSEIILYLVSHWGAIPFRYAYSYFPKCIPLWTTLLFWFKALLHNPPPINVLQIVCEGMPSLLILALLFIDSIFKFFSIPQGKCLYCVIICLLKKTFFSNINT